MNNQKEKKLMDFFVDENGKIPITENMSEETKQMLEFYNENNINYATILKERINSIDDDDLDEEEKEYNFDEFDELNDENNDFVLNDSDVIEDEDTSQSVDDMFADL